MDKSIELKGTGIENKESFFIGGSPPYQDQCKFNFMIDELKYYNDSIDVDFTLNSIQFDFAEFFEEATEPGGEAVRLEYMFDTYQVNFNNTIFIINRVY